jgi:hypothetical protein
MFGMAVADDALADFDVEAEIARELAALPLDCLPDDGDTAGSFSSSIAEAGCIPGKPEPASSAMRSTEEGHAGKQDCSCSPAPLSAAGLAHQQCHCLIT